MMGNQLENTIQILEDALAQGRRLKIVIEFFLNDEGEPEVDYEVTEDGEHAASDVALGSVSDTLIDIAGGISVELNHN